jgi:hypothetical protein
VELARGCGSGELCELPAGRGAEASGTDAAAAPYRRPDGSYRFENRFGYVIAEA